MTPLRQKMLDAMLVRGLSPRTQRSYLMAVTELAKYYHRSPDQLSGEELQGFFLALVKERHLSPATCRLYLNAGPKPGQFWCQAAGPETAAADSGTAATQ